MRKLVITLVLALSAVAAQAREAPLMEPGRVVLTATSGQEAVRAAIIAGSATHGWVVAQEEPGKLTLKYNKQGKHEVVVDALFDAKGYELKYVDSKNMNYAKKDEGTVIHPNYNRWIANLVKAIGLVASTGH